jgi:hypothetical protein
MTDKVRMQEQAPLSDLLSSVELSELQLAVVGGGIGDTIL